MPLHIELTKKKGKKNKNCLPLLNNRSLIQNKNSRKFFSKMRVELRWWQKKGFRFCRTYLLLEVITFAKQNRTRRQTNKRTEKTKIGTKLLQIISFTVIHKFLHNVTHLGSHFCVYERVQIFTIITL